MNKEKPKIFLHQAIMTSYRMPGYNKILDANKGLQVLYGDPQKHSSLKNTQVPDNGNYRKVKNIYFSKKREFFLALIFGIIIKNRPKIIITQYSFSNLTIWGLYLLRPFLNFKIIGWNHGWDRRFGFNPQKSLKDKIRLFMLRQADAMIFYSEDARELLGNYTNNNKLFVANNTLDTTPLLELKEQFKARSKEELKGELGYKTKYNIIFTARLEPPKKPQKLLSIFKALKSKIPDISLHIVGSGPLEMKLKKMVDELQIENVNFYGSIYNNELTGKMIYCSDLMIIPSWVGLSIVHSFCFECPLVTFEKDFHPPEIIYLKNGKTGFNFWNVSEAEAVSEMFDYMRNKEMQNDFKKNINKVILEEANIDQFVAGATEAINYCLSES